MFRMRVSGLLKAFGLVLIVGFLFAVAMGTMAIRELKVGGPVYEQIVLGKDLIADILPPPEYVIEAYLETTLALNDPSSVDSRVARLKQLHSDYDDRHAYWVNVPVFDETLRKMLTKESHDHVVDFWDAVEKRFLPALRKGDEATAKAAYGEAANAYAAHRSVVDALVERANARNAATEADSKAREAWFMGALVLVVGGVLAVLIVGLIGMSAGVIRPIVRMTESMRRLADGDLDAPIPSSDRHDEVGDMATSLQVFRENALTAERLRSQREVERERAENDKRAALLSMAEIIERESRLAVERVAGRTGEMSREADGMAGSAERVSVNAQSVSVAAEQALCNVQTVASATEELTASIAEITVQVAESSAVTRRAVEKGHETAETIAALSAAVGRIGDMARLIQDIAGQTNLLALNATIEAARAGDAGRGFAVVAGEVKNLAGQTGRSTEEITKLIQEIRDGTEKAVGAVEEISGIIGEVDQVSGSVAAAMEEQSAATREIARNVVETSDAAREVSKRIADVSTEADNTGAQAAEVRSGSSEVAHAIEELRHVIVRVVRTSIGDADRRRAPRYVVSEPCEVEVGGAVHSTRTINLSFGGAMLEGADCRSGQRGELRLKRFGLNLPFLTLDAERNGFHIAFELNAMTEAHYTRVVEELSRNATVIESAA